MSLLSALKGSFSCPICGGQGAIGATDLAFRWGGMPTDYGQGDSVKWWYVSTGQLLDPYTEVLGRNTVFGTFHAMNYGDPHVQDLIVLQDLELGWEHQCVHCGEPFARVGVQIQNGIFVGGVLWTQQTAAGHHALDVGADYFRPVGQYLVRDVTFECPKTAVWPSSMNLKLK